MKSRTRHAAERKPSQPRNVHRRQGGTMAIARILPDRSHDRYLQKLHQEREHLLAAMDEVREQIRELDIATAGQSSELAADYDREYLNGTYNLYRERLKSVTRSLDRIQRGTFGLCAGCNEAIGTKGLKAIPSAEYCVRCQEELEQASTRSIPDNRFTPSPIPGCFVENTLI